ncbi:MAG: hypothetical protein IT304_07795 [Dehalococcoidia bacterium]|nr:hypothetical protein [Dehalococcoidia bacterium]
MAVAQCQIGGRFSRCLHPAAETCQYCGRPFCQSHAFYVVGHDAVCTRKPCQRKQEDLAAHLVYRERVRQRNGAGLCGVENCGPHPGFECSLCEGHFCGKHVHHRYYPFRDGFTVVERPVSACGWCWQRRKIWRH